MPTTKSSRVHPCSRLAFHRPTVSLLKKPNLSAIFSRESCGNFSSASHSLMRRFCTGERRSAPLFPPLSIGPGSSRADDANDALRPRCHSVRASCRRRHRITPATTTPPLRRSHGAIAIPTRTDDARAIVAGRARSSRPWRALLSREAAWACRRRPRIAATTDDRGRQIERSVAPPPNLGPSRGFFFFCSARDCFDCFVLLPRPRKRSPIEPCSQQEGRRLAAGAKQAKRGRSLVHAIIPIAPSTT